MSLPDFELNAFLMEGVHPAAPLVAAALARIRVGEQWCMLRECENANSDGTVVFLRLEGEGTPIVKASRSDYEGTMENALKHPEKFLRESPWSRLLLFRDDPRFTLRVFTRLAQWECDEANDKQDWGRLYWARWKFPHPITLDWLLNTADEDIWREVTLLLGDEESDCNFAQRWAIWSEAARAEIALHTVKGSPKEHRDLLKSAIIHYYSDEIENGDWLTIYTSRSDKSRFKKTFLVDDFYRFNDVSWAQVEIEGTCECCFALIHAHFRLSYRSAMSHYTAIRECMRDQPYIQRIYFTTPSQHEILESRLHLRDWLRDKVSSTELAELME